MAIERSGPAPGIDNPFLMLHICGISNALKEDAMYSDPGQKTGATVSRLRLELGVTQAVVAEKAGLDQSRVSRIEKGEVATPADVDRVLDALAK